MVYDLFIYIISLADTIAYRIESTFILILLTFTRNWDAHTRAWKSWVQPGLTGSKAHICSSYQLPPGPKGSPEGLFYSCFSFPRVLCPNWLWVPSLGLGGRQEFGLSDFKHPKIFTLEWDYFPSLPLSWDRECTKSRPIDGIWYKDTRWGKREGPLG